MGSACSTGDIPLEVEADICQIFSESYREDGIRLQRLNAALAPPRLTDRDCSSAAAAAAADPPCKVRLSLHAFRASVMDRGPSQWKMKLPAEATLQVSAEEGGPRAPTQSRRRWSSVIALPGQWGAPKPAAAPPSMETKQNDAAAAAPAADVAADAAAANAAAANAAAAAPDGAAPSSPAGALRTEKLCETEVLQQGCCTIRFDTMRPLLERLADEGPLPRDSKLTPVLPHAESKRHRRHTQAVLVAAKPLVLQSTLPLPQQAEVYCEVELLSFVPFKSYVSIGVASAPYPVHHLPGLLPGSCALLSTGQVFTGTAQSAADGQVLMGLWNEITAKRQWGTPAISTLLFAVVVGFSLLVNWEGDVIGCLFCRKSGQILFFLNGEPVWHVVYPEIMLDEEAGAVDELPRIEPLVGGSRDSIGGLNKEQQKGKGTGSSRGARPDMYVTIGLLGKGELEINFGGKGFNLSGEITRVSKGAIQSTAPIAARAFGYRLASFHVMLGLGFGVLGRGFGDELKLFYSCFNPPMVHKAKGMVVLNISRAAVNHKP
ncbi:hypothetical protein Emag_006482 [Eimeria magna]